LLRSTKRYVHGAQSLNQLGFTLEPRNGGTDGGGAAHASGALVKLVGTQMLVNGSYLNFRDLEVLSSDPVREYNRVLSDPSSHRGQISG